MKNHQKEPTRNLELKNTMHEIKIQKTASTSESIPAKQEEENLRIPKTEGLNG